MSEVFAPGLTLTDWTKSGVGVRGIIRVVYSRSVMDHEIHLSGSELCLNP